MDAQNMAEARQRSNGNVLFDFREAEGIELLTGPNGMVWVNIDGVCAIRIQNCKAVFTDTSNAAEVGKVVMPNDQRERVPGEPINQDNQPPEGQPS